MTMEVGCIKDLSVITKDGKMIGTLNGADIDTEDWTVPTVKIDIEKDMVEPLGLEKSLIKGTRIKLSTDLIELVGDIVQLGVTTAELREYF
jgi:sporulation protein YlmC with PRC-barrel domain